VQIPPGGAETKALASARPATLPYHW